MAARPAQLDDTQGRIGLEPGERRGELVIHRPRHRVAGPWPIERDPRDHAVRLVANRALAAHARPHGEPLPSRAPSTSAVCWPNNGGGRLTLPGVSLSLTGMPSVRTGPSTGWSTTSTIRLAAVCGDSNTCG